MSPADTSKCQGVASPVGRRGGPRGDRLLARSGRAQEEGASAWRAAHFMLSESRAAPRGLCRYVAKKGARGRCSFASGSHELHQKQHVSSKRDAGLLGLFAPSRRAHAV